VNSGRPGRLACGVLASVASIAALGEREARAGDVAARLDYVAEPTCPAVSDFEAVVAKHLGYSPFQDDASERVVVRMPLAHTPSQILEEAGFTVTSCLVGRAAETH